jgi:hypothetical protein
LAANNTVKNRLFARSELPEQVRRFGSAFAAPITENVKVSEEA